MKENQLRAVDGVKRADAAPGPQPSNLEHSLAEANRLMQLQPSFKASASAASWLKRKLRCWLFGYDPNESLEHLRLLEGAQIQTLNHLSALTQLRRIEAEELIAREAERHARALSAEIAELRSSTHLAATQRTTLEQRLQIVESVVHGLEGIVGRLPVASSGSDDSTVEGGTSDVEERGDYSYLILENRYRGSEEAVAQRLRDYVPLFSAAVEPVLEIGAGRGELQQLFREASIPSYGLELDHAMVERCQERGLPVQYVDGIAHLSACPDRSLGGLIAIQVVEHLPLPVLQRLLKLAAHKVVEDGCVVFETINTSSILALSSNYFRDPTHSQPLHPDTMRYLAELSGLREVEVQLRSPYPSEAQLQLIEEADFYPEALKGLVRQVNAGLGTLNRMLFGFQDYALIAKAS